MCVISFYILCRLIPGDMDEVLLYTENVDEATAEIEAIGGRVSIQMGKDLLIANVPADVVSKQDAFLHASASLPSTPSKITRHNAKAYEMYREDKLGPQPEVQKWTEKTAPKSFQRESPLPTDSPYTMTLRGKISLILVVVSGPGSLAVSNEEFNQVNSEVIRGLQFWVDKAPADADLSFALFSSMVPISAANGPVGCSWAGCHNVFAVPAYKSLGYSSIEQLATAVKNAGGAVGGFVAFFSKYRQSHFAYAYFGGGPIYMQYSNDGWGPDQIDRVFAHETGHVFNAPDEYTKCNCYTNYGRGSCTAKNANCAQNYGSKCTSNQQACIMDSNDLSHICANSKKHVGWC